MGIKILGSGHFLPAKSLSNDELSEIVDTSDEWIRQRVGIRSRHISSAEENSTHMTTEAAKDALEDGGVDANDLDLIVVATSTSDWVMPSQACELQSTLGVTNHCPAFDVNAACGGFIYALNIVEQYFKAGSVKRVLVVASERISRLLDWKDRATCVLFGDGAGAVVLGESDEEGLMYTQLHAAGKHRELLCVANNLADDPFDPHAKEAHLNMDGRKVFKHAVRQLSSLVSDLLEANNLSKGDIDYLVPHQANERIIRATAKQLGMSMDQVILTLDTHGNTSAASIPLAFDVSVKQGKIKRGDLLLMEAFGAGFVWGSALVRY